MLDQWEGTQAVHNWKDSIAKVMFVNKMVEKLGV